MNTCKDLSSLSEQKLCSSEPHFYILFPATGIAPTVHYFQLPLTPQQVAEVGENLVEEEQVEAVTQAMVAETEVREVALQAAEVVGMTKVVAQQDEKTWGQNSAWKLPVSVQVELLKEA